jgi:hypothetical protein
LTTQEALEQAGKMQIVPSYSASSPPFFEYRHNARLGCTTISGDHLVEEEESPLPQMRKVAPALDWNIAAEDNQESRFLVSIFDDLDSMQDTGRAILHARLVFYLTMPDSTKE